MDYSILKEVVFKNKIIIYFKVIYKKVLKTHKYSLMVIFQNLFYTHYILNIFLIEFSIFFKSENFKLLSKILKYYFRVMKMIIHYFP